MQVDFVRHDLEISVEGETVLRIYAPVESVGETNELGLSVLKEGEGFRALITGDMGATGEEKLLDIAQLARTDVLVAGHHGSDTSTSQALLDVLRPQAGPHFRGGGQPTATPLRRPWSAWRRRGRRYTALTGTEP